MRDIVSFNYREWQGFLLTNWQKDGVNWRGAPPSWEISMDLQNKITLIYVAEEVYLWTLLKINTIKCQLWHKNRLRLSTHFTWTAKLLRNTFHYIGSQKVVDRQEVLILIPDKYHELHLTHSAVSGKQENKPAPTMNMKLSTVWNKSGNWRNKVKKFAEYCITWQESFIFWRR